MTDGRLITTLKTRNTPTCDRQRLGLLGYCTLARPISISEIQRKTHTQGLHRPPMADDGNGGQQPEQQRPPLVVAVDLDEVRSVCLSVLEQQGCVKCR